MNREHIGTFPHKVYTYHTKDKFGNIALNKLIPLILDSAGDHAETLGFGKDYLLNKNYTWVLSRINVELVKLVDDIKTIYIDTWINDVKSAFSYRLFKINDGKGNDIAYASTYWSIINTETRRITPIQKVVGIKPVFNLKEISCETPRKLVAERGELAAKQTAQYCDLDYNGHVNSNRYLDWGINTLSPDFLEKHKLSRIELNYTKEVYWEDIVYIYKTISEDFIDLELYNESQQATACKMRLHFKAKDQCEK